MSGPPKDDKIIVKRPLEPGVKIDFHAGGQTGSQRQTYSDFLKLDQLLFARRSTRVLVEIQQNVSLAPKRRHVDGLP